VEIDGNKPDVEDGWRWLEVGEVMASGDEVAMCNASGQVIQWVTVYEDSLARGNTVTPHLYRFCRRRVTPDVPEAPQSRPAETRASRSAWDTPEQELAWFKKRVKWLDGEEERLRLTEDEILSCKCAEATLAEMPEGKEHSDVLWAMLARLRGDS
jgi:hypothetical protein